MIINLSAARVHSEPILYALKYEQCHNPLIIFVISRRSEFRSFLYKVETLQVLRHHHAYASTRLESAEANSLHYKLRLFLRPLSKVSLNFSYHENKRESSWCTQAKLIINQNTIYVTYTV